MKTSNVVVNTKEYVLTHGEQPEGGDRWMFFTDQQMEDNSVTYKGSYSEAKAKAKVWAAWNSEDTLFVGV
jgi:hypothetical protein